MSTSVLVLALIGCTSPGPDEDAGTVDAGTVDAGADNSDAGVMTDAGPTSDAGPTDTWSSFADAFMQAYCVRCHSTSPKNFNSLAEVRANAENTRCGVSDVALDDCGTWPPPRQFPVGSGPFPSDEDRARLIAWLDEGAPE